MGTQGRSRVVRGLALAAAISLVGCSGETVQRLLADPQRYTDREVTLKGDVKESFSLLGRGVYVLDDGTGRIWVISDHGVPRKGTRVKAAGRVKDVMDLGGLGIPGEAESGLVLVEREHWAR